MDKQPDKRGDERVEELLSQLKGIFGKLSHPDETHPRSAAPEPTAPPSADPEPAFTPAPLPPEIEPPPAPELVNSPTETTIPVEPMGTPATDSGAAAPPLASPVPDLIPSITLAEGAPPQAPPGVVYLATAVCFPDNRAGEAQALAQKLETLTPKFMKVSFRLTVRMMATYNPKAEWREALPAVLQQGQIKAAFVVADRPLEESKRKAFVTDLEAKGIYYQEVPIQNLDKKAYFTDVLLGMVFFFDSQKSAGGHT